MKNPIQRRKYFWCMFHDYKNNHKIYYEDTFTRTGNYKYLQYVGDKLLQNTNMRKSSIVPRQKPQMYTKCHPLGNVFKAIGLF